MVRYLPPKCTGIPKSSRQLISALLESFHHTGFDLCWRSFGYISTYLVFWWNRKFHWPKEGHSNEIEDYKRGISNFRAIHSFTRIPENSTCLDCGNKTQRVKGRGEAVPYARYGETLTSVKAQIETLTDIFTRQELNDLLTAGSARNAVDCALWDVEAKATGKRV